MEAVCFRRSNAITWFCEGEGVESTPAQRWTTDGEGKKEGVQVGWGRGWSVAAQQLRRGLTYRDPPPPPPPPPPSPPPPSPSLFLPGKPDDYQLLGGDVPLVAMAIECQSRAREGGREGWGEGRGGVMEFTPPHTPSVLAVHRASVTSS